MKKLLAISLSIGLFSLSLHAATVAHYEFNGTGTATVGSVVTDSTGNHHGMVAGDDLVYGADPLVGSYLRFDADGPSLGGLGNRVEVPGSLALVFTVDQAYTFEVIFRTTQDSSGTNGVIISKGADVSNPDSQWWLRHQGSGQLRMNIEGDGNNTEDNATTTAGTAYNDGEWHHVAAVFNGTVTPKRLDVYVDGVLKGSDTAIGTLGIIGGADTDPVIFGEFASLVANRSFAGDIAAIRFSDTALTPDEFLPIGVTFISDVVPADRSSFLPASTVASFVVNSPTVGVVETNIHVTLNGADISSQLAFTGTDAQRTVTLPALSANQTYHVDIEVTDLAGNVVRASTRFNTFTSDLVFIEGEDYNFDGGQFIDNPQLSSTPGPNNYLDRLGLQDIDYYQTNTPAFAQYRIGDQMGTQVSPDALRQEYIDAVAVDPGVADYMARDFANTEWANYTRTFPASTYRVYARMAKAGSVPIVLRLDEVTAGSTTPSQTLAPIGFFRSPPTGSASDFEFVALTDALGRKIAVPLSGVRTLRLTMLSGTAGMNLNYLVFVPPGGTQVPFVASVSPAAGAGNESANVSVEANIRNGDTQISAGSVQMKLDGANVTPTVTPTALGANVSYTPSNLSTGRHTVTLIFDDNAATSVTNEWQFMVANLAVFARWNFNEQPPGNFASTNAGAIQDASGNTRHGTAASAAMPYVTGSFNYGNTPALTFTTGPDRVVVPDPSGSFNFTGSFTFEALVRTTSGSTSAALLAKNGTGDGEGEYWWRVPGAAGGVQRVGMNGFFLAGTTALNDGNWHHVAMVFDQASAQIRLYVDYTLDAQLDGVMTDRPIGRPADLQIGGFIGTSTSEFDGDIDFIRISNGALEPAQFIPTSVALQPIVKALLPVSDARTVSPTPRIEAELQNRDTAVVESSLKMFVDGNDVTASATKTSDAAGAKITYVPTAPLVAGLHTVETTFNDTALPANSWTNSWSFTVVSSVPVLGFYRFDEKAPGNVADTTADALLDASASARHATASAALPYVAGSPDFGDTSALQFTVGGGHVIIPDATEGVFNFAATQSITLEAVVRTVTIGQSSVGSIVAKQGATPGEWWWRINANGTQQFFVNNGTGSRSVSGTTVLNDGLWHHVAVIFDADTEQMRAYVDYQLDGSAAAVYATPGLIGNDKDVWIGAFQAGTRQLDGDVDLVRITGAALDPSWFVPPGGIAPQLELLDVSVAGGNVSFGFVTEPGRSYVVQSSGAPDSGWADVETVPGDGSAKTVNYPATAAQQYFRVRVE